MRARSLRWSLAEPTAGSNGLGSEGMMTRGRRRRLLAESSDPLGSCHSQERALGESSEPRKKTKAIVHGPQEWRDWANLLPDLVEDISGRLLSLDVAEYLHFRAVCKPWRELTDDPHGKGNLDLDSRFRPRVWVILTITPDARPRRRLLSLATGSSLCVDLPALSTHCHMCAADGLFVLFHRGTNIIRLLNPLSNTIIEFPPISSIATAVPALCFRIPLASIRTRSTVPVLTTPPPRRRSCSEEDDVQHHLRQARRYALDAGELGPGVPPVV
ncbi:unnamed protein product [Urochloa humidicola]